MPNVRLFDEDTLGARFEAAMLAVEQDQITLRDLISLRVRAEVRKYNLMRSDSYYGLVQPRDMERLLIAPTKRAFRPIDADDQVSVALKAFKDQRYVVLLPDRQAIDLDEVVEVKEGDAISFLRLVPLVGG